MSKALEYILSMVGDSSTAPKTEAEALDILIKSHKRQREEIGNDTTMIIHLSRYHHFLAKVHLWIHRKVWREITRVRSQNGI